MLFVVDASGSMAARQRMGAVKGAVLSLLLDAYQRRDKVGLITFRGPGAELALPPTSSVEAGAARLETLPTGGRTPLAAGPAEGPRGAAGGAAAGSGAPRRCWSWSPTAGRPAAPEPVRAAARAGAAAGRRRASPSVVVDCESGPVRLGLAGALGRASWAEPRSTLDELRRGHASPRLVKRRHRAGRAA